MGWNIPWNHGNYREGTAYRKNVNHEKKPKEWTDRECWREIKKCRHRPYWSRSGRKQKIIKFDHRRHRSYSKRVLDKARKTQEREDMGEELYARDWHRINNPWNWD